MRLSIFALNYCFMNFPETRLRRLRKTEALRKMLGQPLPGPGKFIWPVFVVAGNGKEIPIEAMPGQSRYSIDKLLDALDAVVKMGIGGIMVFGVVEDDNLKSHDGSYAYAAEGLVQNAVKEIKKRFPDLLIFTDVCLCAYTSHGHCGLLNAKGNILNDPSIDILGEVAVSHAAAGADGVAPSAMMDGQICAIRSALDKNGLIDTIVMSYSTKFASAMYGPFREAADSAPAGRVGDVVIPADRKTYQLPYNNINEALRESRLDELEGADILMVKPALFYLDIIAKLKDDSMLPVAAYNVSGEYSMMMASAGRGWADLQSIVCESIAALQRAGTDIFISYWANQYDKIFKTVFRR